MAAESGENTKNHAAFIWSVADLLRGDYKQSEYGKVILPFTVLRRFDCVLAPVKAEMLDTHAKVSKKVDNFAPFLDRLTATEGLWNISKHDLTKLISAPDDLAANLKHYINGFSPEVREVLDRFEFGLQINRLDKAGLLYLVVSKFAEIDLHPDEVSNTEMGYLYEELIRRFSELSNETAGEHFTPREVIRLMVHLLFREDDNILSKKGAMATLYDPACGTGGMLSVAQDYVADHNPQATLNVYGQELNSESYAICRSDMMLKGQDANNIKVGNSLKSYSPNDEGDKGDQHAGEQFDYLLANPPFGVEWKKVKGSVTDEHDRLGFGGRYGAGLPRINDGSFLFLQHMISKMRSPDKGGARLAIVFNGSPLFTGSAGSGESEIRRWIIENDWLEAVVALPDQLFYNTGISTYFWIVSNRKSPQRKGKVQLIDARESFTKMRKSLGEKRKEISDDQIAEIVRLYANFDQQEGEDDEARVKIFPNESFGFMRITVERPLRLRWELTSDTVLETIDAIQTDTKLTKLTEEQREGLTERIRGRVAGDDDDDGDDGTVTFEDEAAARKQAKEWMAELDIKGKPIETVIVNAMSVRDPDAEPVVDAKGNPTPDSDLRDNENVPLPNERLSYEPDPSARLASAPFVDAVDEYVEAEVHPYVPDAWVDYTKTKIGYEIPLTRHFYVYTPPRPLEEIDEEIRQLEREIRELMGEVLE